jgi:iron complex outermembrane receptor protein
MVNMFANYEISDNLRANAELNFYNGSSADPNRQPFYQSGLFGGSSATLILPIDYPFLHPDDRQVLLDNLGSGATSFGFHKAMDDLSQSGRTDGTTDMLRLVLGLEGEFEFAGRDVRWDVSWNRGESRSKTNNTQLVEENYREALDLTVDGSGNIVCASGNSECVPLNIFGYVTDPAVIDYVTLQGYENSKLTQRVVTGNLATDLIELPGGDWQMAVGYEMREEAGDYQPDYFLANGLGRTAALEALNGGFDTEEYYIETRLPLLAEDFLPIVSAFDVEGAFRTVDHSSAGSGEVYNIGLRLALDVPRFGNITFRANDTESVRSPAIAEAFLPRAETFAFANDPCDFRYVDEGEVEGGRAALCAQEAASLGYDYDPTSFQSTIVNASQQGFTGGNPDLINENSQSESIGVVVTPSFVEDLTFSVDFIDVYLNDAIESLGLTTIMAGCYDGGNLNAPACGQFTRDPATFQINGFQTGFVNAGYRILKGYQSELDWSFDLTHLNFSGVIPGGSASPSVSIPGQFRLRANFFDLNDSRVSVTGDDAGDTKGLIGNSSLRGNVNLMYMLDNWTFNWRTMYLSGAKKSNTAPPRTYDIPKIDEYFMHTLFARYSMSDQLDISVAVRNVTDVDVPYGMNSFVAIGAYDIIGRSVTGSIKYRF